MQKEKICEVIRKTGILPTAFIYNEETACPLAQTLEKSGIPVIEVLQRSELARGAVTEIKKTCPAMLVGAGTVMTVETAKEVCERGADFIVMPGFQQTVVEWCLEREVLVIPGCSTMTEIAEAYSMGLRCLKFFPANQLGGPEAIRQLGEIYPDLQFIPTGGLTLQDACRYLRIAQVAAAGGIFMMPEKAVREGDWKTVAQHCERTVTAALGLRLGYWDAWKAEIGLTTWSLERMKEFCQRKGLKNFWLTQGEPEQIVFNLEGEGYRIVITEERDK